MTECTLSSMKFGAVRLCIPPCAKGRCCMSTHREQAAALIAAGERDLLALRLLNQTGRAPHEVIGFHAQQAAEKFIKAVLVINVIVFERTQDLVLLYRLAEQQGVAIAADVEQLRALNARLWPFLNSHRQLRDCIETRC